MSEVKYFPIDGLENSWAMISTKAPTRLKVMLIAAYKTYTMGNASIDRTLKQYGEAWEKQIHDSAEKKEPNP